MRRILLLTTVLTFSTVLAAQAEEPLKLSIGGFYKAEMGWVENTQRSSSYSASNSAASKFSKFSVQDYGALNFIGSSKLDNGITVSVELDSVFAQYNDSRGACGANNYQPNGSSTAKIQLRPNSACNSFVKRAFGTVSGAYGSVVAGEREDITAIVHTSAPDASWGLQDGDWTNFVNTPANHSAVLLTNDSRWTNRGPKITYVTPAFFGLSAGVTYAPFIQQSTGDNLSANSSTDNANWANVGFDGRINGLINRSDFAGDAYSAALAYNHAFGPVSIKADVGATMLNFASERLIDGGLQISAYGFTLGGSYLYRGVPSGTSALSTADPNTAVSCNPLCYISPAQTRAGAFAGHSEDIALAYAIGPYAVSVGYFGDRTANSLHASDTTSMYAVAAAYTFGPGMSVRGQLFHYNMGSGDKNTATENKGNGFITGMQVNF